MTVHSALTHDPCLSLANITTMHALSYVLNQSSLRFDNNTYLFGARIRGTINIVIYVVTPQSTIFDVNSRGVRISAIKIGLQYYETIEIKAPSKLNAGYPNSFFKMNLTSVNREFSLLFHGVSFRWHLRGY
ncbi:unnamed protein product [Spodoptera littoralis]|uniref:Uncharacterized protein n=1 Tax=Spodoptera littoralis TaxID=7109 RepID=A0A9P0MVJ9_SPOLI|nr:unnamed protein product [Spodoptera littoralis]CAH1634951.1 unnamed protein product [Spodoptera littoralis]